MKINLLGKFILNWLLDTLLSRGDAWREGERGYGWMVEWNGGGRDTEMVVEIEREFTVWTLVSTGSELGTRGSQTCIPGTANSGQPWIVNAIES